MQYTYSSTHPPFDMPEIRRQPATRAVALAHAPFSRVTYCDAVDMRTGMIPSCWAPQNKKSKRGALSGCKCSLPQAVCFFLRRHGSTTFQLQFRSRSGGSRPVFLVLIPMSSVFPSPPLLHRSSSCCSSVVAVTRTSRARAPHSSRTALSGDATCLKS